MKKRLCALALALLLAGCTAGGPAEPSAPEASALTGSSRTEDLSEEEAVRLVEERLMANSQKLCPNPEAAGQLRQSEFLCEGEVTVEEQPCWKVSGGGSTFAITRDGEHLYEWQEVTGSFAQIE